MERSTLKELIQKLERLTLPRLRRETEKIIRSNPELIFRKQDEFRHGQRPDGSIIGYYRNPEYQAMKQAANPMAGGTVDLILTGSTIGHLVVVPLGNGEFELYSTDYKWPALLKKYGGDLKLINKEHFIGLQQHEYAPLLTERMREIIK